MGSVNVKVFRIVIEDDMHIVKRSVDFWSGASIDDFSGVCLLPDNRHVSLDTIVVMNQHEAYYATESTKVISHPAIRAVMEKNGDYKDRANFEEECIFRAVTSNLLNSIVSVCDYLRMNEVEKGWN